MRSSILTSKRAKALRRGMTEPEVMLWSRLRRRADDMPPWRRQHAKGRYILDFFCPAAALALEIDGSTHGDDAQVAHDERRDVWLRGQGIEVYRVAASSVFRNADEVADGARRLADERAGKRKARVELDLAPSTTRSSAGGSPPPSYGQGRQER